jgi:drug/metabolite transporter (DMT)-like permease
MKHRYLAALRITKPAVVAFTGVQVAVLAGIIVMNQAFNVGATACFAASGHADRWRTFIVWQIVGGFFGLGVQLTFSGLVRYWSLTAANMIGIGMAFVSAQLFAAYLIFNESFALPQWLGTALVFVGIILVAGGHR